jgi:hypothetical protein
MSNIPLNSIKYFCKKGQLLIFFVIFYKFNDKIYIKDYNKMQHPYLDIVNLIENNPITQINNTYNNKY